MNFFQDMIEFVQDLAMVDLVFFFAVLVLMLLIISLIYFIRENNGEEIPEIKEDLPKLEKKTNTLTSTNKEMLDLKEITAALEAAEPSAINLNNYEEEQEQKAIISYDELLKHKNDFALNYTEEENIGDNLTVKKVDLDNLVNKDIAVKPNLNVTLISYEKEEAFLEALKTLQQKLN